jgi:hypothetical protein
VNLIFNHSTFIRSLLILLLGAACCIQPGAQDIQLEENFDALGAAFGEFGLDDASSKFFAGLDDPTLMSGVRPVSCEPVLDNCAGVVSRLVEVSPGDWALWTENWSFSGATSRLMNGIRSDLAIARADTPECVFRVFGDACVPLCGESFPQANGPFGPFHQIAGFNDWADGGDITLALEKDLELGLTFWSGWKNYYEEGGGGIGNDMSGPKLPGNDSCFGLGCPSHSYRRMATSTPIVLGCSACAVSLNSDWAEQKTDGSYFYRASLGAVTGGYQEYSTDSTNGVDGIWSAMKDVATGQPIDTRGVAVNADGPGGTSTVGDAATVYLGFSAFKHTMIDDITLRSFAPPPNAVHHWLYL